MRIRRAFSIVVVIAVLVGCVWDLVLEFRANDPVGFFARDPGQLLILAAVAVVGGLCVAWVSRVSPSVQRRLKLTFLGGFGAWVSVFTLFAGIELLRLRSSIDLGPPPALLSWMVLGLVGISSLCWFEFWRVWRTPVGTTRWPNKSLE